MGRVFVLGPQRPDLNLGEALELLGDDGRFAVISAGWQEGEADLEALQEVVQGQLVGLQLYQRADALFAADAWLREQYRSRQDQLIELQRLYRIRLSPYMQAARTLLQENSDEALLRHEQRESIAQLRALDRHHLRRIAAINAEFATCLDDSPSRAHADHRKEIMETLDGCQTVLMTGGNVAVLINRLQLFGLASALREKNIVAWSAGAMALTERIVLFHDNTPEGDRDAELFNEGCGLIEGVVFLPDAKHRLKSGDKTHMALMSRRFAPAGCMTLDSGALLAFDHNRVLAAEGVRRLARSGSLRKVSPRR